MKNTFNNYLNTLLGTDDAALNLILAHLSRQVTYRKNEIIYPKGKIPTYLSYIETGNAIALSQSKPNRQVLRFWTPNQLICPSGFFCNGPAIQSIVALDDCLISALSYRQLYSFLDEFPQAYKIINAILSTEIKLVELNIKNLQHNTTSQNHEALLDALALSFDE